MKKYNWRLDCKEAKKLYKQGFSCAEVGEMLGATRSAIWGLLKSHNTEMRKKKVLPYIIYDGIKFTTSEYGYYRATLRKKHIALHRYKWEKEIGKISKGYDIHHKNGKKGDNRIENLECLLKAEHTKKYSPHHNQFKNYKTKHLYENRKDKKPIFDKQKNLLI